MTAPTDRIAERHASPAQLRWWVGNSLTVLRLVAGAIYPFVPASWRVGLVVFAAVSDGIDGWLARKLHATSLSGQVLDPIADKLCVLTILLVAACEGIVSWGSLAFVGARDLMVIGVALLAVILRPGSWRHMPPRVSGKLATAGQFAFLVAIVFWNAMPLWLLIVAGTFSVIAGLDYVWVGLCYYRETATRPAGDDAPETTSASSGPETRAVHEQDPESL